VRIAQIAWLQQVFRRLHQGFQTTHHIRHIAKRSRLPPVAIDREWLIAQSLRDEVGNNPAIVLQHTRTIGVEYPCNLDGQAIQAIVVVEYCFSCALTFIVAGAGTDRIDMADIALALRVLFGIAIDFARRRLERAGACLPRKVKHVLRAKHACIQGADRVSLVLWRGCGARQIVDAVERRT
jgi:hypothetical protein